MAAQNVLEFTDANFDEQVLQSKQPVLVDVWTEWCPPCRMLAPTIEKLATDYVNKVRVGKMDAESNRQVATKYRIEKLPTILLFSGGQIARKFEGLRKEQDFKEAINAIL